jgi:putative hydrolase of the HAD superfamily
MSEVSPQLFNAIYERFTEAGAWLIYDDVIPALQELESMGMKLAVISNWDDRLVPLLEKLGLATYFDEVVVSAVQGAHKPDVAIFRHAAEKLGVPVERLLHVGDSLREDVNGALGAGAKGLRIRRSGVEKDGDVALLTGVVEVIRGSLRVIRKSD